MAATTDKGNISEGGGARMKPKQIVIVVIAFVVLAVIYAVQKSRRYEVIEGLGYEKVLGEELATSDIQGFKCFRFGKEDRAVHLAQAGESWIVRSKFGAPADKDKVDDFIEKLGSLEGELRSSSGEVLADYSIDDASAIHLSLLDANGEEKKRLLFGKQGPDWSETFVRIAGSNDVYLAGENLRRAFGITSDDAQPIDSKQWCALTVMKLPKDDLSRIEVKAPHKRLVLELQDKVEAVEESEAAESPETPLEPTEPEKEWALVKPKLDTEPKTGGLNRILSAFAQIQTSDIVGRGNLEEYGLGEPVGTCLVITKNGGEHRLSFGDAAKDGRGGFYVRLNDDDLVYVMDRWQLDSIFLKMSQLIDIDAPVLQRDQVARLKINSLENVFEFEKKVDTWKSIKPDVEKEPKGGYLDRIAGAVANLRSQDLITAPPEITGLDKPALTMEFSMQDGEKHSLLVGGEVPLTGGDRFIRLDDEEDVWTISESQWNTMSPDLSDLFDLTLSDFKVEDVTSIRLRDATGTLELTLADSVTDIVAETPKKQWVTDDDKPIDQYIVSSILSMLSGLEAEDLPEDPDDTGLRKPAWSVKVSPSDGETFDLDIGNAVISSGYYARVNRGKTIFLLPAEDVVRLMDLTEALRN